MCEVILENSLFLNGWKKTNYTFRYQLGTNCIPFNFHVRKVYIVFPYDYYLCEGSTISQKVNDFYYNQYLEIFDARKKLMESYRKNYPSWRPL